jgi:hypothetical protein
MKRSFILSALLLFLTSMTLSGCYWPYWGHGWYGHGHDGGHGGGHGRGGGGGHRGGGRR